MSKVQNESFHLIPVTFDCIIAIEFFFGLYVHDRIVIDMIFILVINLFLTDACYIESIIYDSNKKKTREK